MRCLVAVVLLGLLAGCGTPPPAPDAVITGVALSRERVALPPEVAFDAVLLDVTDPDQPPIVLGRQHNDPVGNPPYALQIPYPSARFVPKGRYEVRATVTVDGRLLLASGMRHPVPQDAAFRRVDVQLQRLPLQPATSEAGVPLALTYWRLREIAGQSLPRPGNSEEGAVQPYLVLQADEARATGSGGCNRFLADYALEGGRLRFGRVVSGITLCLPGSAVEEPFFAALAEVESFRQKDLQLELRDAKGKLLLLFEAAQTPLR